MQAEVDTKISMDVVQYKNVNKKFRENSIYIYTELQCLQVDETVPDLDPFKMRCDTETILIVFKKDGEVTRRIPQRMIWRREECKTLIIRPTLYFHRRATQCHV